MVWTDSESAFLRVVKHKVDENKLLDTRISRLLAWIWYYFPTGQIEIRYLPGEHNKGDDSLSRWKSKVQCDPAGSMLAQKSA